MSFGDISRGVWTPQASASPTISTGDEIARIGQALQDLQRECQLTKDAITAMRRRKIGPSEKNELVNKIKEIKDREGQLKSKMDSEYQKIDTLPRPEAAPKRTALGKLMKDFDKVKVNIQAILNESALVKVVNERGEVENFARTSSMAASLPGGGNFSTGSVSAGNSRLGIADPDNRTGSMNAPPPPPPLSKREQQEQLQQMKLKPLLQGREVDDAILEERERDIKKMNQDLLMVNEMFKDMSVIVEKQGKSIDDIAVAADMSHDRAKAGLQQVNQAAEYQPGCVLC